MQILLPSLLAIALAYVPIVVVAQVPGNGALSPSMAAAQAASGDVLSVRAMINGPEDIAVGRTIVLDASLSRSGIEHPEYAWYVGDSRTPISRAVEALYTPEEPGPITFRLVLHATLGGVSRMMDVSQHTVIAYSRKVLLFVDPKLPSPVLTSASNIAASANIYARVLQPTTRADSLIVDGDLSTFVSDHADVFAGASAVFVLSDNFSMLQSLMQAAGENDIVADALKNQTIVLITDGGLSTAARTVQSAFAILQPRQIVITDDRALPILLTSQVTRTFESDLNRNDIDFLIIDHSSLALRPWNVFSYLVNFLLRQGVAHHVVILLLVLPFIATILAFFKQVIGITTFGLYTPSVVALSFLALGWRVGIVFLFLIILTGYITRSLVRRLQLLYIPKVAIILTVVSVTLLLLLSAGSAFGVSFSRDSVFILLIMSTLTESFINLKREEGMIAAVFGIGETVLASLVCVFIVQWPAFQAILLAYPEIVLLALPINILLGRWTGLRLIEHWRFREVFRHLQEE